MNSHSALSIRGRFTEVEVGRARKHRPFAAIGWHAGIDLVQAEPARPALTCALQEEAIVQADRVSCYVGHHRSLTPALCSDQGPFGSAQLKVVKHKRPAGTIDPEPDGGASASIPGPQFTGESNPFALEWLCVDALHHGAEVIASDFVQQFWLGSDENGRAILLIDAGVVELGLLPALNQPSGSVSKPGLARSILALNMFQLAMPNCQAISSRLSL
nr:hypothetical protein [Devosia psychrophila]